MTTHNTDAERSTQTRREHDDVAPEEGGGGAPGGSPATDGGQRVRSREEAIAEEANVCPECDGNLVDDERHGETVCADCGLVVEEDEIDRGPEWRAFDSAERDQKSRVGAPTTKMLHDEGLSTNIGWQDKDAYGNALSANQRQRMSRLRTWNERLRTTDHSERNLKQALGEIERMASALGLPENVRETASVIYRRALEEDLLPGRSIEGIATASLHAAARMAGVPRSIDEVARVSRVDEEGRTVTSSRSSAWRSSRRTRRSISRGSPRNWSWTTRRNGAPGTCWRPGRSRPSTPASHRSGSPPPRCTLPAC